MTSTTRPGRIPPVERGDSGLRRLVARIADAALWLGSIVGALALLLIMLGLVSGIRPLIFRSGSMSPTIPAGSLGLARDVAANSVERGDVVTVRTEGTYVTHRVVASHRDGNAVELRLRGDANRTADPRPYRVQRVDKLLFSVPGLGYPVAWLSRPPGVFLLAGYAAIMLAVIFRRGDRHNRNRHDRQGRHARGGSRPGSAASPSNTARHVARTVTSRRSRAAWGVLLLGTAVVLRPSPSWATFTDNAPVSGSTIQAYTVPTTTLSCGLLGVGVASVTLNWTAVSGATSYTLHYGNNGTSTATTTATSYKIVTVISGGTAWVTVNRAFGSTTWTSTASNKRTYTVAVLLNICT